MSVRSEQNVWDESLLSQIEIADLNSKWGKKCAAAATASSPRPLAQRLGMHPAACPRPSPRPSVRAPDKIRQKLAELDEECELCEKKLRVAESSERREALATKLRKNDFRRAFLQTKLSMADGMSVYSVTTGSVGGGSVGGGSAGGGSREGSRRSLSPVGSQSSLHSLSTNNDEPTPGQAPPASPVVRLGAGPKQSGASCVLTPSSLSSSLTKVTGRSGVAAKAGTKAAVRDAERQRRTQQRELETQYEARIAELEARLSAEARASAAEREAATLRNEQEQSLWRSRLAELEAEVRAERAGREAALAEVEVAHRRGARAEEAASVTTAAASELVAAQLSATEERERALAEVAKERAEAQRIAAAGRAEVDAVKRAAAAEQAAALEAAAARSLAELETMKQQALAEKTEALQSASQELMVAVGALLEKAAVGEKAVTLASLRADDATSVASDAPRSARG